MPAGKGDRVRTQAATHFWVEAEIVCAIRFSSGTALTAIAERARTRDVEKLTMVKDRE